MVLRRVGLSRRRFRAYEGIAPASLMEQVRHLARRIRNLRVIEINATPRGGGVAEMLISVLPLLNDLGLDASWYVLNADARFFEITKALHNFLQGKPGHLSVRAARHYLSWNERFAKAMARLRPDVLLIHDPQPAAAIQFFPQRPPMALRMHIDTSHPNRSVFGFFDPIFRAYDRVIFTLPEFAPARLASSKLRFFAPAIDPLSEKNRPIGKTLARRILQRVGIDPTRPLLTQVSRFDPWKDPLGVWEVFLRVRRYVPGLQFAYVGIILAQDDPEAAKIVAKMQSATRGDPDAHLFWNRVQLRGVPIDTAVNAFQSASSVILQKSLREGFGMTVTEAMWKGTPVVAGDVGGIRQQVQQGRNGYRVRSIAEAAFRTVTLLQNAPLRQRMGDRAREEVRRRFLIPRLLYDRLCLFQELVR